MSERLLRAFFTNKKVAKVLYAKRLRSLFEEVLTTRYLDNHAPESELPDGVVMFDTFDEAYAACKEAEENSEDDWYVYPREDTDLLDYIGDTDFVSASEFAWFRCRRLYGYYGYEDEDSALYEYYAIWDNADRIAHEVAKTVLEGGTFGTQGLGIGSDMAADAKLIIGVTLADMLGDYLPGRDMDIAEKRWRVWASGYGVISDYDGVVYCYRKP